MKQKVVRKNYLGFVTFSNEDLKALPASNKIVIAENDAFWGVDLVVGRIVKVISFFNLYL